MKPSEIYAIFQSYKALASDPSFSDVNKSELAEEFKRSLPPLAYTPHAKATITAVLAAFDTEIANGRTERGPGPTTERKTSSEEVRGEAREGEEAQEPIQKPRGKQGRKLSSTTVADK